MMIDLAKLFFVVGVLFMEEENKNKPNLLRQTISRIINKLHGCKVFKRVGALVVAVAIAVSLSACGQDNNNDNNGGNTYVCDDCGGNHKTEDHNKQTDVGYSALMHSVLESAENQALVADYAERSANYDDFYYYLRDQNPYYYCQFNSHPFAFLAKQGYDVEKIKSGELSCQTFTFVKKDEPTKLYMSTKVQSEAQYGKLGMFICYDNYLISYDLSKQEMADYKKVHEQELIYANFMNDAISAQKQETIHLKTLIGYKTYQTLFNSVKNAYNKERAQECFYISSNLEEKAMNMFVISGNYSTDYTLTYATYLSKTYDFEPERNGLFLDYYGTSFNEITNAKTYKLDWYCNTVLKDKSYDEFYDNKTHECLGLGEYNPNLTK